jgi:hypothetical protein
VTRQRHNPPESRHRRPAAASQPKKAQPKKRSPPPFPRPKRAFLMPIAISTQSPKASKQSQTERSPAAETSARARQGKASRVYSVIADGKPCRRGVPYGRSQQPWSCSCRPRLLYDRQPASPNKPISRRLGLRKSPPSTLPFHTTAAQPSKQRRAGRGG